ncbi:MAG: lysylphosphatidylglycerol synthase transmembrane domain-containing protein [Planctomycetota bacterium]
MNKLKKIISSRAFQMLLGIAVLGLIVKSTMVLLPGCTLVPDFTSPWFAIAVILAIVYRIINAYGWALVLHAMKMKVNGLQATRIWLHAESRRWLPGGVWGYASRAVQAGRLGVPAKVASASMLIELLLTMAAALLLFVPVFLFCREDFLEALGSLAGYEQVFWIGLIAIAAMCGVTWVVRKKLAKKFEAVKQRVALIRGLEFDYRRMMSALGFYLLMGCLNGAVTWCLIASMTLDQYPPVIVVIAATSFAWVVGFLAVFAPGGMVVREAMFATILGLWIPYSTALAIAVLARVIQLAAEVIGMVWIWASRKQAATTEERGATLPDPDPSLGL